jgi:hypothetical protein
MNHTVMRIISSGAATLLAILLARTANAQCINQRLATGASTRGEAMGNANTTGRDDDVIFYGPAQLAVARGTSVSAERYYSGLASGTMSTTARISSIGVGLGAQIVEARNVDPCLRPVLQPNGTFALVPAPRAFSRSLLVVGAAQTLKRFHLGASAKYAAEQADAQRTSRLLLDLGASRDFSVKDFIPLSVALAVQNIGTSAADTNQLVTPLRAALGLASGGPVGPLDLAVAAQIAVERTDTMSFLHHGRVISGIGAEVGYTWLDGYSFAVRVGERVPPTETNLRHFTFGAGVVLDRISIDYAGEDMVGFRIAHRLGIRLR